MIICLVVLLLIVAYLSQPVDSTGITWQEIPEGPVELTRVVSLLRLELSLP